MTTTPGLTCDVPSLAYRYSFAPRSFAKFEADMTNPVLADYDIA